MVTGSDSESIVVLVASTGHTLDIKVSPNETIANILPRIAQASSIPLSDLEICQESGEIISPNELIGSRRMLRLVARGRCGGEVDRAQASSPPENLSQFWRRSWRDLKHNLYLLWPVFLGLFFYWLISGFTLHLVESKLSLGQALYLTWITMTTVGFGDITPATVGGRILVSVDALIGIILIGIVLWLITSSLQKS